MAIKKNNSGLIITLVFLIILSMVLGGYIIYDKLISSKTASHECVDGKDDIDNEYSERELVQKEIKYSIIDEKNFDLEFTYYNSTTVDTVDYYFDSCLTKDMPTVIFEVIDGNLAIKNYYDDIYFLEKINNIKEFFIRKYQSNGSQYLVLLTTEGEVYFTHLWGICSNGAETVITPKELEDSFTKLDSDKKINSIGGASAPDVSLVVLYNDERKEFLSFD